MQAPVLIEEHSRSPQDLIEDLIEEHSRPPQDLQDRPRNPALPQDQAAARQKPSGSLLS